MPAYKTIALGLIEEQPPLYERLRQIRTLPATLDQLATLLKTSHEEWMEQLSQSRPGSDPRMIASEALEIASKELEERLASESKADEAEPLSLDAAMTFLRNSPTA
jgi:hypothetical protein